MTEGHSDKTAHPDGNLNLTPQFIMIFTVDVPPNPGNASQIRAGVRPGDPAATKKDGNNNLIRWMEIICDYGANAM